MTLDELNEARELATRRAELLQEADDVEKRGAEAAHLFGHKFDLEMEDVLRMALAGELRRRARVSEARLRELGVVFPGDPLPGVEPVVSVRGAPTPREVEVGHPLIVPRSWDRQEGTFTVAVPCDPATSVRWLEGGLVQVDEALNPHGLSDGPIGTPVIDRTEGVEVLVGAVQGWGFRHDGIELHVRLLRPWDKVRAAIEAGRLHLVGVGYEIRNEEIVSRPGQRPLADVLRWSLKEIRLHRADALAEAA